MGINVSVKGLQEIKTSLKALSNDLQELDLSKAKEKALALVRSVVPKRTGKFAQSHTVEVAPGRISVGTNHPARALNYGIPKRGIQAQHFYQKVDPALENLTLPILDDVIQQKIDQRGL